MTKENYKEAHNIYTRIIHFERVISKIKRVKEIILISENDEFDKSTIISTSRSEVGEYGIRGLEPISDAYIKAVTDELKAKIKHLESELKDL